MTMLTMRVALSILWLGTMACAAGTADPAPAPYTAAFDFSPPSTAAPNSGNVSFAVVNGRFASDFGFAADPLFQRFSAHLGSDFYETLAAKGFTSRGPYRSYEEMTFPDRQSSDLVLEPNIELGADGNTRATEVINLLGPNTVTYSGTVTISGRVNLTMRETLSSERMWARSIAVTPQTFTWKSQGKYSKDATVTDRQLLSDPGYREPLTRALDTIYSEIMQTAWSYLEPAEMAMVKAQSQDVRKRWVPTTPRD